MFGISDLITVAILDDAFQFASKNPHHIEFVLSQFTQNKALKELVGQNHIKDCIDFIVNNRVNIVPYYSADLEQLPSIGVVSQGHEGQQFLGDHGREQLVDINRPVTYADFNAKSINGSTMIVPSEYKLHETLWPGLIVENKDSSIKSAKLESIFTEGTQTVLELSEDFEKGTSLKNWIARSVGSFKGYKIASSIDDVDIHVILTTEGDIVLHRLLSIVLRWAFKRSRLNFDKYGLQVATFNWGAPNLIENAEHIFESRCTISAKFTDSWIEQEFNTLDSMKTSVCLDVDSDDDRENVRIE